MGATGDRLVHSTRSWSLCAASLIDWLSFAQPLTSISFSPNGDFLATSHAHSKGIYLWYEHDSPTHSTVARTRLAHSSAAVQAEPHTLRHRNR